MLRILRTTYALLAAFFLFGTVLVLVSQPFMKTIIFPDSELLFVFGAIGYLYVEAVILRVLARTFPLRADLRLRHFVIGMVCITIVSSLAPIAILIIDPPELTDLDINVEGALPEEAAESKAVILFAGGLMQFLMILGSGVAVLIWTIFFIVILLIPLISILHIHIRRRFPFEAILFLRRFGGPADAALMSALMQIAPRGTRVVLMASPGSKATSWDPMVLTFSGFRWTRPWANLPIYLRSGDMRWKDDISRWISFCDIIVFDGSDSSASMSLEWSMVEKAGALSRTLVMSGNHGDQMFHENSNFPATKVAYQLSWKSTFSRMIVGLIGLVAAGYFAFDIFGLEVALVIGLLMLPPLVHRSLTASSILELQKAVMGKLRMSRRVDTPTQ